MSQVLVTGSCPARGQPRSPARSKAILEYAAEQGDVAAVPKHGCLLWSISYWRR